MALRSPGGRHRRGSAGRAPRQWVLPVVTTTAGRTSWHRAAGRAEAHGEHRGSGYCPASLRQQVVHRGVAPQGGRQRAESVEAAGTACHHMVLTPVELGAPSAGGVPGRTASLDTRSPEGPRGWRTDGGRWREKDPVVLRLVHWAPGNGWVLEEGRLGPGRSRGPAGPRPGDVTRFAVTRHRCGPSEPRRRGPGPAIQIKRGRHSPTQVTTWTPTTSSSTWHGGAAQSGRVHRRRVQARRHLFAETWDGGRRSRELAHTGMRRHVARSPCSAPALGDGSLQ